MSCSLMQIYAICLYIIKKNSNIILYELFNDFIKSSVSRSKLVLIHVLVSCYEERNICINSPIYKVLDYLVVNKSGYLCKTLLYS
jgi:hypothetical protein